MLILPGDDSFEIDPHSMGEGLPDGLSVYQEEIPAYLLDRPRIDIPTELATIQNLTGFRASHGHWRILHDVVGLIRRGGHGKGDETYQDKLAKELRQGKTESATYGLCRVLGEEAVLFAMNWDFFAGSLGVVAGEKFQEASDLARHRELPFISIYASSGVRQHENFAGLAQMTRMVEAVRRYKEGANKPHIAVLLGNVWGGVSASSVPLADISVAMAGTNFGFAGPKVIEAFEGVAIAPGAQSAEANSISRNVDVIVPNSEELVAYLGRLLKVLRTPDRQHRLVPGVHIPEITARTNGRVVSFGAPGLAKPSVDPQPGDRLITVPNHTPATGTSLEEQLFAQFNQLISGAGSVDLELLLQRVFRDAAPLYNHYTEGERKTYPATVAAIAKIGDQPFVVAGTQPSYRLIGDVGQEIVLKKPASPAPQDFNYVRRVLDAAERLGLPAILVTDTLGAEPTLANERNGLSRSIAELILRGLDYKYPVISVITGALGSGGGLATAAFSDHMMMLDTAMAFVAEPKSAASILYRTPTPTPEQVMTTLATMKPTAQDQLNFKLIDEVIKTDVDPNLTAEHLRTAILAAFVRLSQQSNRSLHHTRQERIRRLRAFEIDKGNLSSVGFAGSF